mgnify:CR=1 FL=1
MEDESEDQKSLRRKIVTIQQDTSLSSREKQQKIQELMAPTNNNKTKYEPVGNVVSIRDDGHLGCKHYKRGTMLIAPCCDQAFVCRLCHDENSDHQIDRFAVKEMICLYCKTRQSVGQCCCNPECSKVLGDYYCDICHLFSNDGKDIFHCDDCGICRVGKGIGIDYKHCNECSSCIHVDLFDTHKCIENALRSNCAVCCEEMFTSTKPVSILRCGHYIHVDCLENTFQEMNNTGCPICRKTICDMSDHWLYLDEMIENTPMPKEHPEKHLDIYCYDCEKHTQNAPFHFYGIKCKNCGSYNTS